MGEGSHERELPEVDRHPVFIGLCACVGQTETNMRVTILGAIGLLGKALTREWKEDDVTGFGSADGDIRDAEQVLRLVQGSRPDWIVLAAAYTDVDGCETNRDLAFNVNCRGAVNIAQAAKQQDARKRLFQKRREAIAKREQRQQELQDAKDAEALKPDPSMIPSLR